jgi:phosphatidylinositol phospholipase C, delta
MRMRDQSAGPILVRRRSDSNTTSEVGQDVSDLELDPPAEDIIETERDTRHRTNGLGITVGRPSYASSSNSDTRVAPAVSAILQAGTWVNKHSSKNKRKRIKLWLDPNSARVCWHATNLAKSFFVDDVREVRVGAESRNARDGVQIPDEHEYRWITIVYEPPERSKGRTIKTMHLTMDSKMVVDYWTEALSTVTKHRTEIMNALAASPEKSERGTRIAWTQTMERAGRQGYEEKFTLDDAIWLCAKLEINCSPSAVKTHFVRSDCNNRAWLDYPQYVDFVNSFKERKDIQHLFTNISYGTGIDVKLEPFLEFLRNDQKVDVDKDRSYWEGVFEKFSGVPHHKPALPDALVEPNERTMSMQNFQNFLTSNYNAAFPVSKSEPTLDRPLNEYFISSSHNTYLLGRQFAGESSVEGYIAALIKGCRCIEIDCWNGEEGRPMVTHGRTMTTRVPFEDCVSTIAKYAFHSSAYPLIVSLEVHCTPEQQRTMVDIMLKHWKGPLVEEPLTNDAHSLPSPDELKNRILVKVKVAEEPEQPSLQVDASTGRSRARSLGSNFTRAPSVENQYIPTLPTFASPPVMSPSDTNVSAIGTPRGSITSGSIYTPPSTSSDDSDDVLTPSVPRKTKSTSKIVPELGRLGVYVQGIKYGGFQAPEAKAVNHIFSFSENTFDGLCTKNGDSKAMLEQHNLRHLMRVYPSAKRITSGNFDPLDPWRRGVQMVALNWQTYDIHQQINEAMFAAGSDRVGYVLKPEELRPAKHLPIADILPNGLERKDKRGKKEIKFTVEIKSAQRLPRPRSQNADTGMNPYLEFEMYCAEDKNRGIARGYGGMDTSYSNGVSGLGSPVRKRTRIIEGNGFDPIFNSAIEMKIQTKYPSLIFIRWTVWNSPDGRQYSSNSTLLATYTAKLDSLQQGYRHLPLCNTHGEQFRDAKLFVKITKQAPVSIDTDNVTDGHIEPRSASPRPDMTRSDGSWARKLISRSRNPSQRRSSERQHPDGALDREPVR